MNEGPAPAQLTRLGLLQIGGLGLFGLNRGGAVYGSSDRIGASRERDPVTPGDLAATIFGCFGLDASAEVRDVAGRPYRLADWAPLQRLFG